MANSYNLIDWYSDQHGLCNWYPRFVSGNGTELSGLEDPQYYLGSQAPHVLNISGLHFGIGSLGSIMTRK